MQLSKDTCITHIKLVSYVDTNVHIVATVEYEIGGSRGYICKTGGVQSIQGVTFQLSMVNVSHE
jgi:hypothetical protein